MINLRDLTLACFALTATLGLPAATSPAYARAPLQKTQAPGYYRFMLGDFEVTALSDGTIDLDAATLLKQPAAVTERDLARAFITAPAETSVTAYLVNTGSKLILIDTGAGALFGPTLGKLLANLRAAGYAPDQIDDVLLSHLHPDHAGGLMQEGKVAFPNATVHAAKRDADYWLAKANLDAAPAGAKPFFQGAMVSVTPYVTAGKFTTFDANAELVPGVRSIASAGHSAGHTSFEVASKGQKLVVVGDLIHVAAVQLDTPTVSIAYDSDGPGAASARATMFKRLAADGTLIAAAHLSFPGLGHLRVAGRGWTWLPASYARLR